MLSRFARVHVHPSSSVLLGGRRGMASLVGMAEERACHGGAAAASAAPVDRFRHPFVSRCRHLLIPQSRFLSDDAKTIRAEVVADDEDGGGKEADKYSPASSGEEVPGRQDWNLYFL